MAWYSDFHTPSVVTVAGQRRISTGFPKSPGHQPTHQADSEHNTPVLVRRVPGSDGWRCAMEGMVCEGLLFQMGMLLGLSVQFPRLVAALQGEEIVGDGKLGHTPCGGPQVVHEGLGGPHVQVLGPVENENAICHQQLAQRGQGNSRSQQRTASTKTHEKRIKGKERTKHDPDENSQEQYGNCHDAHS